MKMGCFNMVHRLKDWFTQYDSDGDDIHREMDLESIQPDCDYGIIIWTFSCRIQLWGCLFSSTCHSFQALIYTAAMIIQLERKQNEWYSQIYFAKFNWDNPSCNSYIPLVRKHLRQNRSDLYDKKIGISIGPSGVSTNFVCSSCLQEIYLSGFTKSLTTSHLVL